MKKAFTFTLVFLFVLYSLESQSMAQSKKKRVEGPDKATVMQIQSDFLQLEQPIKFTVKPERQWVDVPLAFRDLPDSSPSTIYFVVLHGEAKRFAEKYDPADIIVAIRPYLRDPNYDVESYLIISSICHGSTEKELESYQSRTSPGDWEKIKEKELRIASAGSMDFLSESLRTMKSVREFRNYRIPPDQILPSSLKKNEESSLVSSATPVETPTATPQATPSQTPTPQGKGTVEPPKTTPSATMAKPEPKPQPTPATQTEQQKQTWPLWLASVAVVLGAIGVVIHRNRKK